MVYSLIMNTERQLGECYPVRFRLKREYHDIVGGIDVVVRNDTVESEGCQHQVLSKTMKREGDIVTQTLMIYKEVIGAQLYHPAEQAQE